MLLQRGKFLIDSAPNNKKEKVDVIDLDYMGSFEYEGNAIPLSRTYIEYFKDKYVFYPTQIFDKNGNQMFIYANSDLLNSKVENDGEYILKLAKYKINNNYSLWEYIKYGPNNSEYNFWWDIEGAYFIFFGEKYKDVIQYYIDYCYFRDGKKDGIKRIIKKAGYSFME